MFMAIQPPSAPTPRATASPPPWRPRLGLHLPNDPDRGEVEAFIQAVYRQHYAAQLPGFAPQLVSLREGGQILAAAGYRAASQGPLFLERYLPAAVETLLSLQSGQVVQRGDIVEVGHLAGAQAGAGRRLIHLLGPHLAERGCEWVVGTLTEELRHLFQRLGIRPLVLGRANPDALGPDASHWGSYYSHQPQVLAGHLPQALHLLARRRADRGESTQ